MTFVVPAEWNLTRQQEKLFCTLMEAEGAIVSNNALRERISPFSEPQIVKIVVFYTRKTLAAFHVNIESIYGKGYRIPDADKERLRAGEISLATERQAA